MCDYTQVQYKCSHLRYVVRAWCTKYQETHKRCPANVVAMQVFWSISSTIVLTRTQRISTRRKLQFVFHLQL
ncbi:hypothetical protein EK21DRAFT_51355 [Setomelanomma holmii]|uniref:Uncharacterized protein n=1 Tax=Setomelanomma holmii TaxID=210430 RepID=A0A9P4HK41_9PLEO|nr:hypothetical protein EK21DRAFT_51355 [Setomelanomma holmii]